MSAEPREGGSELVLLGASDTAGLLASIRRLVHFLEQAPGVSLADVAFTCARDFATSRSASLAVIATSVAGLRARLVSAESRIAADAARVRDKSGTYYFRDRMIGEGAAGRLAFVFPGAPSFYPGMVRDLSVRFHVCRRPFDELEAALKGAGLHGWRIRRGNGFHLLGQRRALSDTCGTGHPSRRRDRFRGRRPECVRGERDVW